MSRVRTGCTGPTSVPVPQSRAFGEPVSEDYRTCLCKGAIGGVNHVRSKEEVQRTPETVTQGKPVRVIVPNEGKNMVGTYVRRANVEPAVESELVHWRRVVPGEVDLIAAVYVGLNHVRYCCTKVRLGWVRAEPASTWWTEVEGESAIVMILWQRVPRALLR